MSTSLILGAVGGVIGFFVGGPTGAAWGFAIGSLAGSLLDPPKVQGPRLNDLKLQSATYGKMIPFFWGTGRIAGNIIDQTDLEEHEHKSGGKGGPETDNYTYTVSFDVMIGAARVFGENAIDGVLRIWADGRLWWSVDSGDPIPCTVYLGSETQLPDPTFEAIHGVGEVPAYRGYAHCVFTDLDVAPFFNRIPSLEFEVFTSGGDIPWRVSTFTPWPELNMFNWGATYANGVITTTWADNIGPNRYIAEYDIYGNVITAPVTCDNSGFTPLSSGWIENSPWSVCYVNSFDGSHYYWFRPETTGTTSQGSETGLTGPVFYGAPGIMNYSKTYAFGVAGTPPTVYRWPIGADLQPTEADPVPTFPLGFGSIGNVEFGNSFDNPDEVWVMLHDAGPVSRMWRLDQEFNLIRFWDTAEMAGTRIPAAYSVAGGPFYVYQGRICFNSSTGPSTKCIDLVTIDPLSGALTDYDDGTRLSHSGTFPAVLPLGNGLCIDHTGVFSLDPPPAAVLLSKIVGDLSEMTPVRGAYDVSELTDEVRWFVIGSSMTVRNAIQSLRQAFFFDGVESDDIVKFPKRSETAVFEIPDSSLCGREYGEESGDPLRTIRTREQELPRTVTLTYIDIDTDYQTGAQSTPRQTTLSEQDVAVEVPIGFTATEAMQKCWTLITGAWIERENFEWSTTRGGHVIDLVDVGNTFPAAQLEPCDVGIVRGRVIRIKTRTESPNGVIKWTGVLAAPSRYTSDAASIYIQPSVGTGTGGFVPQTPPGPKVTTNMVMLDLPLINDTDYPNGFYVAVAKSGAAVTGSTSLPPGTVELPWPYTGNTRTFLTAADGVGPGNTVTMGFITPNATGARAGINLQASTPSLDHTHRLTLTKVGGGVVTQLFSQTPSILVVTGSVPVTGAFNLVPNAAYLLTEESINTDLSPSGTVGLCDYHINMNHISSGTPGGGSWTGVELFKSSDGGTTYASVGSSTVGDIIGTVSTALPNWLGGNNFDESHVITVTIGAGGGTLSSVSETAVLNGANEFALGTSAGWEIIQFKTANLITAGVYQLSGLLRGRRGTEWAMGLHVASETFVMLPTTINVNSPFSELGAARLYKPVSYGKTLASTTAQSFTNTGVALKPYAPTHVEGGRNASGDINIQWIRRTRIGGVWLESVEVPLSEASETYQVNIYSAAYAAIVNQIYVGVEQLDYLAADQTADFGGLQSSLYVGVQQLGANGYGYEVRGVI